MKKHTWLFLLALLCLANNVIAQQTVLLDSSTAEHIFKRTEISCLEDKAGKLSFNDVTSKTGERLFQTNKGYFPKNFNHASVYWYRVKVKYPDSLPDKHAVIEFFDQTTDEITAYLPDAKGGYTSSSSGAARSFTGRLFQHKNFEFLIDQRGKGEHVYYFRVRSKELVNVIIVYRTVTYFVHYALVEYLTYGLFYGMILIFCFHNLLMFMAVRSRQYLYYVLYILSVGIYEMSTDGIAFQFLWPHSPLWNEYAYGIALYSVSIFALAFTKALLQVKQRNRSLYRLINITLMVRTAYFLFCLFIQKSFFAYRFIEILPLAVAFATGIVIWKQGFKPARFFVLAYSFLFVSFVIKGVYVLGLARYIPGVIGHYSMTIGFVCEMVLLSFSIGDQVRVFRKEKDLAQEETIRQMKINADLKDSINRELEIQVRQRTSEVVQKSEEIRQQAEIIESQNRDLMEINKQLELQAEEISRMNVLLEKDNVELKTNIERVTDARIESTELTFEEFSQKYPDREHCNKFLADLKWAAGYQCIKCGNGNYGPGRAPFSRRCSKCAYEESVMHNTIFENNRIPINKAFYIVYLMYTTKGNISSYQLAEKLDIRQSTCWAYAIRVKAVMDERKNALRKNKKAGWSSLVLKALQA
ncbi:chromosome partitioning protein ParA [Mucilaginibacter sp. RS28]|uniref:Chromosome partitioning protein ParA n=1 Tax=Mucilaginibacter straminoryzae TaxID=2932774 RepID=A0A9X1X4X6_9SPHI|nr:7TM diverse intracellular signaling domain-containing protein [Mucilaginibacter straminoryzae]MCJ8211061.1 chromosome partitioning protein ParA [Mucilaginibacter straminoryzae]